MPDAKARQIAEDLLRFIEASPTAAHTVAECARRLDAAGFRRLEESAPWCLAAGDRAYVLRNQSSIVAFRRGGEAPAEAGFRIIGAHTDFPGLRVKPHGSYAEGGYLQLGVEVYGGPLLQTWLDRDLGLAGQAIVAGDCDEELRLFEIKQPLCRIPSLAPHIVPDKKAGLDFNKQDHLPPVLALVGGGKASIETIEAIVAEAVGVSLSALRTFSVELYSIEPGVIGGLHEEFICSRSIDNLASCRAGLEALLGAPPDAPFTQVLALFDNEEVGSVTMHGAGSGFLDTVLERLCQEEERPREAFHRAISRSFIVSADGAHGLHPNHIKAHEPRHHPVLGGGPAVKVNAMERYTTQIEALAHLKGCAARAGAPLQTFVARTDVGTGSTIGPMTASRLGMRSIDLGNPMLAMHSSREMGGTADQAYLARILTEHLS